MGKKILTRQQGLWGLVIAVILALIPIDPTDALDAGTPFLEVIGMLVIYFITKWKGRK